MSKPPRVAIIAAQFQQDLINAMTATAEEEIVAGGAQVFKVVRVAGCYEVPLALDRALRHNKVDVAVVLGYIEKGETLHGSVMGQVVQAAIVKLQLEHNKPVGCGIIGPGATLEQARKRQESHARAAVKAALGSLEALAGI